MPGILYNLMMEILSPEKQSTERENHYMPTFMPDLLPAHEIYKEAKPGIRYYKIMKTLRAIPEDVSSRPYIDEMDQIYSQLYSLQANAARLESQGKADDAVDLYRQLVESLFDDPHPYLRLCDYYAREHNPEQLNHVCQCYFQMAETVNELGYKHPYREELVGMFMDLSGGVGREEGEMRQSGLKNQFVA